MRILLAEPSRLASRLVGGMLEANGHDVTITTDGQDALEQVMSDPGIEVVLTSFELPGLSGMELCWHARLLPRPGKPGIYLMAMSSSLDERHVAEALDAGADDFISKPPSPIELQARLRAAERLLYMQRSLFAQATTDPLTGLFNRRFFLERAAARMQQGEGLALGLIDIDHFKRLNDRFGHDAGDEALRVLATLMQRLDEDACVARLGGEEFAILFEPTGREEDVLECLRRHVEALRIELPCGAEIRLSVSIGLARSEASLERENVPAHVSALLKQADLALYEAKAAGRNRLCCFNGVKTAA